MEESDVALELRGHELSFGHRSVTLTTDLRSLVLALGRTPGTLQRPVPHSTLHELVYGGVHSAIEGKNGPVASAELRELVKKLRDTLEDDLGLAPGMTYLPRGGRQGYYLTLPLLELPPGGLGLDTLVQPVDGQLTTRNGRSDAVCPYRGLDVFREEDVAFFAGRAAFADELHRRVDVENFVALVGPSGSGKSSIVRAGLIPRLRGGASATTWQALTFAPGENPFFSLASELTPLLRPDLSLADLMSERRKLASSLADQSVPLEVPLDELRRTSGNVDRLLLVVDQFEELFTLTREDLRRAFADALLKLAAGDGACVLLTLRADFYGHAFGLSRSLSDHLRHAVVNIVTMSSDELRQAVVEPAANVGLRFEPGLVETILEDVGEQAGALPLLEFALLQLWHERHAGEFTLEGYRAIGGVSGALANWAQANYSRLRVDDQAVARRVLLRLTVPGEGTNHTRQRVPMTDLPNHQDATQVERVVQALVDARLLTTSTDVLSGARSVEISHEALIRSWDQFMEWIETERDWLREHRRLTDATRDWMQRGDEELLYRGSRLADVAGLQADHAADLSGEEEEFLASSGRLEARRERARYLGQAAGGAVGTGLGYGVAFALGFATTNPGPNALILASATFVFLLAVGQATGFAIGIALWLGRTNAVGRSIVAVMAGGVVGTAGYLLFLRFLVNAEPTLPRAAVGASLGIGLGLGLAVSSRRWHRFAGSILGGVVGTTAAVTSGGITWAAPVAIASGLALGALAGAGFHLTSAEDRDRRA